MSSTIEHTCVLCMSTDDPMDCDNPNECDCNLRLPSLASEQSKFIGVVGDKSNNNVCHYFHLKCLYHYHKHNMGEYFTCPLCKIKITSTVPIVSQFNNLLVEDTKRYDHDDLVMQLTFTTDLNISMSRHSIYTSIGELNESFITIIRQLCSPQYSTVVCCSAFDLLYHRLNIEANNFIKHPHSLMMYIISIPIDMEHKSRLFNMLLSSGHWPYTEEFIIKLISNIKMFKYIQTENGFNEMMTFLNLNDYIKELVHQPKSTIRIMLNLLSFTYPAISYKILEIISPLIDDEFEHKLWKVINI